MFVLNLVLLVRVVSGLSADLMESGRALMDRVTSGSVIIMSASVLPPLSFMVVRRLFGLVSSCVSMFLGDHWKEVGD